MNLDVDKYLADVTGRYSFAYREAIDDLMVAMATGSKTASQQAMRRLEDVTTQTMGIGEVIGASITLRALGRLNFAADQTIVPRVTLTEALDDMVARTPTTIRRAAERTAERVSELYSKKHVVAFARSAEAAVTKRVQGLIAQAIKDGVAEVDIGRQIVKSVAEVRKRTGPWSEAYARMSFRTNLNTAVTAGRFRQAQDPDVKAVIPAFRFDSVGDDDTRHNHDAADGMIMKVDNPAWNKVAPPLGYNCRCQVSLVSRPELERMGRITANGDVREDKPPYAAQADPGFRHTGRPDLFMTGASR